MTHPRRLFASIFIFAAIAILFYLFHFKPRSQSPVRTVQESPNLLFITIDTLRPDHLGVYGYSKIKTPTIDSLARSGVLFGNAICQTPLTLVSHSSIFTGLQPNVHGVRDNAYIVLSDDRTTLAEILKGRGYKTAAFIGSAVLDKRYGLAQGFDSYSQYQPTAVVGFESQRRANEVVSEAQEWLEKNRPDRFFVWLHLYDPHFPYDPPEPFRKQYESQYDGEIAYTDSILGQFLDRLKSKGFLADTLIVLMGDHGESLGDHREKDHGYYIYDATLRIPFLLSWPDHVSKGKIIEQQVQSVDVMPTLADLMDFRIVQPIQGKSLVPLIRNEPGYGGTYAYAESLTPKLYYGWSDLKCIRTSEWKYIEAPSPELYNLKEDPKELHNIASDNPVKVSEFKKKLQDFLASTKQPSPQAKIDAERLEQLAALGYVAIQNPSEMLEKESSIDPKTKIEDYLLIHELIPHAVRLMNQGDFKESLRQLKKVEVRFADSFVLYWYMGYCYANLGNPAAAEKAYVKSVALNPLFGRAYAELALTLALLNRHNDGIRLLEQAPVAAMSSSDRAEIKGEIYTNERAFDQAEASFLAALQTDPRNSEARYGLARVYLATDNLEKAIESMQTLASEKYPSEDVYDTLADIFEKSGSTDRAEEIYRTWVEIFPNSAASHYRYGRFLQRTGRMEQASAHLKKAITLKPDLIRQ